MLLLSYPRVFFRGVRFALGGGVCGLELQGPYKLKSSAFCVWLRAYVFRGLGFIGFRV